MNSERYVLLVGIVALGLLYVPDVIGWLRTRAKIRRLRDWRPSYPELQLIPPPMSCHTVTTPKATVEFTIKDCSVSMKVLHLDERFAVDGASLSSRHYRAANGFIISSVCDGVALNGFPVIRTDYIDFGAPKYGSTQTRTAWFFDSNAECDAWLERAEAALREWAVEWEGFKETPKPKSETHYYRLRRAFGNLNPGYTFALYGDLSYLFEEVDRLGSPLMHRKTCATPCSDGQRCISLSNSTWNCYQCGQEIREVVTCHVCYRSSDGVTRRSHQTSCSGRVTVKTISVP